MADDLPRSLNLVDSTTMVVGSMIGSGIFLKASGIAQLLPDPGIVLMAWLVAGLLSLFGALALAELGAMFPKSGGLYVYLYEAYGPLIAFLFGWSLLAVLQTGSIAGLAAGAAQSLAQLGGLTPLQETGLAIALIVGLSWVNVISVRAGAGVLQNLFTLAKCVGIVVLIGAGLTTSQGSLSHFQAGVVPAGAALASAFGMVMLKALWAYDGWVNGSFVAGEVRNPQRNLPLALAGGTALVILIYVATNAAYHYVLPLAEVQAAKSVAVLVAERCAGTLAALAVTVLTVISMVGTLNSSILSAPRVYFAMARDGLFLRSLGDVHPRFRTPHLSIWVQCLWSLGLLAMWGTFETLTDNVVFVFWIFYALGAGAVIVLRRKRPDLPRPFQAPGYPLVSIAFILMAVLLIGNTLYQAPKQSLQALVLLGLGLPVYAYYRRNGRLEGSGGEGGLDR